MRPKRLDEPCHEAVTPTKTVVGHSATRMGPTHQRYNQCNITARRHHLPTWHTVADSIARIIESPYITPRD